MFIHRKKTVRVDVQVCVALLGPLLGNNSQLVFLSLGYAELMKCRFAAQVAGRRLISIMKVKHWF